MSLKKKVIGERYAIPNPTDSKESNKIVVSYNEFADRKADHDLFSEENDHQRIEYAQSEFNELEYKRKLQENDHIVYEMYNKYRFLLEELDLYKKKLFDQISTNDPLVADSFKEYEIANQLTTEEKDYKIYVLEKELRLAKWNTELQKTFQVLKDGNLRNISDIREQQEIINTLGQQLTGSQNILKAHSDAIREFKQELKIKLTSNQNDGGVGSLFKNGEIDIQNEFIHKLTKHIITKAEIQEKENHAQDNKINIGITDDMNVFSTRINEIIMELNSKADVDYVDKLEDSLSK